MLKTSLFHWAEDNKIELQELAEILGFSLGYLSRLKNGHMPITRAFKVRCRERLGKDAEYLFTDGDELPENPIIRLDLQPRDPGTRVGTARYPGTEE